jgi:hypothetical protein
MTIAVCVGSAAAECPSGYSGNRTAYGSVTQAARCIDAEPDAEAACMADMTSKALIESNGCDAYCAVVPGCTGNLMVTDANLCDDVDCSYISQNPLTAFATANGDFDYSCICSDF